jgi:hypothetical protein
MKRLKNIVLITVVSILVLVWIVLSSLNLFCALSLRCVSDASGWWSLFLGTIGVPVLVFQLYSLRKTIKESTWRPVLDIGVMIDPLDYQFVLMDKPLPKKQTLDPTIWNKAVDLESAYEALASLFPLRLVIRNAGQLAAKHIKIHMDCKHFPGDEAPIVIFPDKEFKMLTGTSGYVFRGSESGIIHPKDFEAFRITITQHPDKLNDVFYKLSDSPEGIAVSEMIQPGLYQFHCTIWADGLEEPKEEDIEIVGDYVIT